MLTMCNACIFFISKNFYHIPMVHMCVFLTVFNVLYFFHFFRLIKKQKSLSIYSFSQIVGSFNICRSHHHYKECVCVCT